MGGAGSAERADPQVNESSDVERDVPGTGWFSYVPIGGDVPEVRVVGPLRLRLIQYVGFPLWDTDEHLGDEFDWFHEQLGLTRATYDALAQWYRRFEELVEVGIIDDFDELRAAGRELRDRVAAEVGPAYEVLLEY